jgi:spore coat polysaccharide biosynthesis protein SpsF (cytidylyltransferase family)/sialic acid synthase SpsE
MTTIYNIIEIANVHAGDFSYLNKLVDEFSGTEGVKGIKFQPFKYDQIAREDFAWYDVYKKLYFTPEQWKDVITRAATKFEVWIDTFDGYSYDIIAQNLNHVSGLKFQSSILFNRKLISKFSNLNLSEKKVLLNVSGIEQSEIPAIIAMFEQNLKPKEIILQVGFQGYPTELADNGLNKISVLQKSCSNRISFADHIDANSPDSKLLPVLAAMQGATIIEKHVKLSGSTPEYDHYSSLDLKNYVEYLEMLEKYNSLLSQSYINAKEKNYLSTTIQIPTLNKTLGAYSIPNLLTDVEYKRTAQSGLRTNELEKLLEQNYILAVEKNAGQTILKEDLKKANIAVIIACRLKSSRLPKKATLKIGELSSVELCIKNALKFKGITHTILATSTVEEDAELEKYTYSPQVIFHKGDPIDVMQRYIDIIDTLKIDIIVRVTADMPYISNDILEPILKSHFETGADYSRAKHAAIGTNLEVINTSALKKVKRYFPTAEYSEYMTYYFTNNPEHFKINEIDLPEDLVRNYRLTLDYPEDLAMFNKIEAHFKSKNVESDLRSIIALLDADSELADMNKGMEVKYHTDKSLVDTLMKYTKIKSV